MPTPTPPGAAAERVGSRPRPRRRDPLGAALRRRRHYRFGTISCSAGPQTQPDQWVDVGTTTGARLVVPSTDNGVIHWFRVAAVSAAGPGAPVTVTVTPHVSARPIVIQPVVGVESPGSRVVATSDKRRTGRLPGRTPDCQAPPCGSGRRRPTRRAGARWVSSLSNGVTYEIRVGALYEYGEYAWAAASVCDAPYVAVGAPERLGPKWTLGAPCRLGPPAVDRRGAADRLSRPGLAQRSNVVADRRYRRHDAGIRLLPEALGGRAEQAGNAVVRPCGGVQRSRCRGVLERRQWPRPHVSRPASGVRCVPAKAAVRSCRGSHPRTPGTHRCGTTKSSCCGSVRRRGRRSRPRQRDRRTSAD